MVVAPGVAGSERAALLVAGRGADELSAARPGQRVDGGVEPELRERVGFAAPRPEAGAPEQALGLRAPERSFVDGNPHYRSSIGKDRRAL